MTMIEKNNSSEIWTEELLLRQLARLYRQQMSAVYPAIGNKYMFLSTILNKYISWTTLNINLLLWIYFYPTRVLFFERGYMYIFLFASVA